MYWYVVTEGKRSKEIDSDVLTCHPFEIYHKCNSDSGTIVIYMREINETEYKLFKGTLQ